MKKFSGPVVQQFFIGSEPQRHVIAYLLLTCWQRYLIYQQHMTEITSPRLTIKPMMDQEAMKWNKWTAVLDHSMVLPFYSYKKVTGQVRTSWKPEIWTFSSFIRCKPICIHKINVPSTLQASAIGIDWLELQHTACSSSIVWKTEQLLIARTSHTGLQVPHRRCSKWELLRRDFVSTKRQRDTSVQASKDTLFFC